MRIGVVAVCPSAGHDREQILEIPIHSADGSPSSAPHPSSPASEEHRQSQVLSLWKRFAGPGPDHSARPPNRRPCGAELKLHPLCSPLPHQHNTPFQPPRAQSSMNQRQPPSLLTLTAKELNTTLQCRLGKPKPQSASKDQRRCGLPMSDGDIKGPN
ncbi:hypothetical protein MHYP_G00121930 [Metynnis hypsauchen]